MSDNDNETSLADNDDSRSYNNIQSVTMWRRLIAIVPGFLGYHFILGMTGYFIAEYTHHRLDHDNASAVDDDDVRNYTYDPCQSNKSGPGYDRYKHVQQQTAMWQTYYSLARVLPAMFTTLVWTSFSDVIGRRKLLIVCMSAFFLKLCAVSLVVYFHTDIAFLLIGEVIDGVGGSSVTVMAILIAMLADITEKGPQRTKTIVVVEMTFGAMSIVSIFGSGYYIKYAGFFYPAITGVACVLGSLTFMVLFLPETLQDKTTGGCNKLVTSVSTAFKLYFKPESRSKQIKYILVMLAFIFYTMQLLNRGGIETVYQLGRPFCMSPTEIGWFASANKTAAIVIGISGIFILKKLMADDAIIVFCCVMNVISYVVEGFAHSVAVLYSVAALGSLSLMPVPMIRSLMSQLTPPEKQGAVSSTVGAVEIACWLVGSFTGNLIYSATLTIMNGFVFFMLAVMVAISAVFLAVFMCVQRRSEDNAETGITKSPVTHPIQ